MYARPQQHTQQHVAHPHTLYSQQHPSPYVAAAAVPSHYAQPHEVGMVAGQSSAANAHPQLPQLHAYPHLQLQYTYPSPLQTAHQPPTPQTQHVYAQPPGPSQQPQAQQAYRIVPTSQPQHAQVYAQPGHLQPHAQAYRPGAPGLAGHPPRAPSPLAHQVQTAQNGQQQQQQQQHIIQQAHGVQPSQAGGAPARPPNVQARATLQRPVQHVQAQQSQPSQATPPRPPQPPSPAINRQTSYNTRTRSASARATSVTVNGIPLSNTPAAESSMPPPSRGPSPAFPSPGVETVEVEPAQASRRTSRVNSQSVNGGISPKQAAGDAAIAVHGTTAATAAEASANANANASGPAAPGGTDGAVQPPPIFPYYGSEVVPAYLPGQQPLGIGLGYGLPDPYGGFRAGVGGEYFADVKGGMDGWLDHEGLNTDPLLQPGSAVEALGFFRESLSGMVGGAMEEWSEFIQDHFDDGARLQITLSSAVSGLQLFDLPSTSLARFFSSFPSSLQSTSLHLNHQTESPLWSPPQSPTTEMPYNALPRHGVRVDSEGEWRWTYALPPGAVRGCRQIKEVVWKVRTQATLVPVLHEGVLKMENLEVMVEEWAVATRAGVNRERKSDEAVSSPVYANGRTVVGEWGLPDMVLRILDILEGMEEMLGVVELAQGMGPKDALRDMTIRPTLKDERMSPVKDSLEGEGEESRQPE